MRVPGKFFGLSLRDPFFEFLLVQGISKHHALSRNSEVAIEMKPDMGEVWRLEFIFVPFAFEMGVCFLKALAGPLINMTKLRFDALVFLRVLLVEHFQEVCKFTLSYPSHRVDSRWKIYCAPTQSKMDGDVTRTRNCVRSVRRIDPAIRGLRGCAGKEGL